jgi:hypothetical protein
MLVITDRRIDNSSLSALENYGFEPILLPPADYLAKAVSAHTDMLVFIGFGRLFCHEKYYAKNASVIDRISSLAALDLVLSDEPTGEKYPSDVLFNACVVGNRLICNENTVSKLILELARENGYEIISVPQGYTKCSVAVVSDNAIITADKAIAVACKSAELGVLEISEGHISLPPYEFGFIGGASGVCDDKVYFCGSIDLHPEGEQIKDFCKKHKKNAVSLSGGELQDVGSLFFIGG